MDRPSSDVPPPAPELRGEILGATIEIAVAPGLTRLPWHGTIIDETLNLLIVRLPGHARPRRVPKAGLIGTIVLGGRPLPLSGEVLRVRPEDRTKRLSLRGPRRSR